MINSELKTMRKIVLGYPKLKERLEQNKVTKEEVYKLLDEMRADFSPRQIRFFEKFLDASLSFLYDNINLVERDNDVQKLTKDNCVVFVPNHQSHADYLAINYKVYKDYGFPLHVAGGNNLNVFPIGSIFRKCGCFFIRRSFNSDINYKQVFEAYLYYLLHEQKPIEFFFEGGRSRTGKLLPPKYGLYQMLLEAHSHLEGDAKKPLCFLPVSIAHEYVPEQKALSKELKGGKKKKESTSQIVGLVKFVAYRFGSIHIVLGDPVFAEKQGEGTLKDDVQKLAFKCFRNVGKNMVVTPTSLLALVLLDEPAGALKWNDIIAKADTVRKYCKEFDIPLSKNLQTRESFEKAMERSMDILIGNKKIDIIGHESRFNKFYSIKEESRAELLYFKNTIVHHFLVPEAIYAAWSEMFCGKINTKDELKEFFLSHRDSLKLEFYLPTVKQYLQKTIAIMSGVLGKDLERIEDVFSLSAQEQYKIASRLGIFSRLLSYIGEGYYLSGLTIESLFMDKEMGFKVDDYLKASKNVFEEQIKLGRIIRYSESYNEPTLRNCLKFFEQKGLIHFDNGYYKVTDFKSFDKYIKILERLLVERLSFNVRES